MPEVSPLGWGTAYNGSAQINLEESGKYAARKHTFSASAFLPETVNSLNGIAEICRKHNARLVLFTPPAYKSYYQNLDEKQLKLMTDVVDELAKDKGCSYVNLLDSKLFNGDDFHDGDHLNGKGAKKLSLFFYDYLSGQEK